MPPRLMRNILRRGNLVTTSEAIVPLSKPQQFWETIRSPSQKIPGDASLGNVPLILVLADTLVQPIIFSMSER